MESKLYEMKENALKEILNAGNTKDLNEIRVSYLGKKGQITDVMKLMGKLSAEERPKLGAIINIVRDEISKAIEEKQYELNEAEIAEQINSETVDVTLPGYAIKTGNHHPLTKVIEELEDFFIGMGYTVEEGPEVETDFFNFEALNLPKEHPARDMQDSFYITETVLLRTHTSPVQVRTLKKHKGAGPIKIICPGKVYRRDDDDATHSHQFMQIEGLVVDQNITMSDLKGTLQAFAKKMFGEDREIRLRPSFFPFTEPSVEVDISCPICNQKGCSVCKKTGWIEALGAGMVHPNVLSMAGFDSNVYKGFAFGMGVERIAMLKYGIDDIRNFYTDDIRFLNQFGRFEG